MKDFDVLDAKGFFLLCTLLRVSRQSINSSVSHTLTIIDPEVITWEFLSPTNLFRAQILYVYEPVEVDVVNEYK